MTSEAKAQRDEYLDARDVREDVAILGASGHYDLARGIYDRNRWAFEGEGT